MPGDSFGYGGCFRRSDPDRTWAEKLAQRSTENDSKIPKRFIIFLFIRRFGDGDIDFIK